MRQADLWIDNERTDPPWNLAAEEYLLCRREEAFAMLWRNGPSVIIGRNQDVHAEVDMAEAARRGVAVVRRLSGGGAVFHDLGNVNFTWIANIEESYEPDFTPFARKLCAALAELGVRAEPSGRNDILSDGKKISGCAHVRLGNRVLYHGTLLFSAELSQMEGLLRYSEEKYRGRGVKSVSARVGNLADKLPGLGVEDFLRALRRLLPGDARQTVFTEAEQAEIGRLRDEKYTNPLWTEEGKEPKRG